jgi:hypothetical protein
MKIVSRAIQTVATGKWDEKVEIEKRFEAVYTRLGNPAARQYRCIMGADSQWTYVKEWEYDSFTAWEELRAKYHADPAYAEIEALVAEDREKGITIDQRNEVYWLLD